MEPTGLSGSLVGREPELKWGELKEGAAIGDVQPVFPRIDKGRLADINAGTEPSAVALRACDST